MSDWRNSVRRTRLYFFGFIPQGVWEGWFDPAGIRWWARPFMRTVYEYWPEREV